MDFFPCFLDIDKHLPTIAFGYTNLKANKYEIIEYFKTTKLSKLFNDDRIVDLFTQYMEYKYFIGVLMDWSKWYIHDGNPINRPSYRETDAEIVSTWKKNIFEFYEKYRISVSLFDRILYTQLMNDHLWNPRFDPMNPKIQDYNKKKMLANVKRPIRGRNLAVDDESTPVSKVSVEPSPSYDDMVNILGESATNINEFKNSNDIDSLKMEAAKLEHMNTLIESEYIFSNFPTNKDEFSRYTSLRNIIHKSLNETTNIILMMESDFDLNSYYESTKYYASNAANYRHLMQYKEFIKENL